MPSGASLEAQFLILRLAANLLELMYDAFCNIVKGNYHCANSTVLEVANGSRHLSEDIVKLLKGGD